MREKLDKFVITLLGIIVTLMGLFGTTFVMLMGGAILIDATNLQFYTQAVMGGMFTIGGFIVFSLIVAILTFKYKKRPKHIDLIERWIMAFIMHGVMLMMVNLIWHFYITNQINMMPEFIQLGMCIIVTIIALGETRRLIKSEAEYVRRIREDLNAELAER